MTTKKSKTKKKAPASRAGGLRASARDLAGKVPDGALGAWRTVDTLPKSQQKTLARASFGVGALLFLFGAPRLLTLLAFIPAFLVATSKATRGIGSGGRRTT